jgi:transposase
VKKKRTYRAKEINSVSVTKVVEGRKGQRAVVGIDVGKEDLSMMLRWDDGTYVGPWHAKNITEIRTVVEFLASVAHRRKLIVAMEPTGTYGDPLRYALTQAGLDVHRVQGKAAHDYAEIFDGVPSQHDCKDAGVVADLAAWGSRRPGRTMRRAWKTRSGRIGSSVWTRRSKWRRCGRDDWKELWRGTGQS